MTENETMCLPLQQTTSHFLGYRTLSSQQEVLSRPCRCYATMLREKGIVSVVYDRLRATELLLLLHLQDERDSIEMVPVRGWKFTPEYMDALVNVEEGVVPLKGLELIFSVFPVLYKKGGGEGGVAIVAKAKVVTEKL